MMSKPAKRYKWSLNISVYDIKTLKIWIWIFDGVFWFGLGFFGDGG